MINKILAAFLRLLGGMAALCLVIFLLTWTSGEKRPFTGKQGLLEWALTISFGFSVIIYGAAWVKSLFNPENEQDNGTIFTGSCRYGSGYYASEGVGFAKLTISDDFLFIRGGLGAFWAPNLLVCNFRIPKDQIVKISQFSTSLVGGSFLIEHNCSEAPPFIVFSVGSLTKVVRELERFDYKFNWNLPT